MDADNELWNYDNKIWDDGELLSNNIFMQEYAKTITKVHQMFDIKIKISDPIVELLYKNMVKNWIAMFNNITKSHKLKITQK